MFVDFLKIISEFSENKHFSVLLSAIPEGIVILDSVLIQGSLKDGTPLIITGSLRSRVLSFPQNQELTRKTFNRRLIKKLAQFF